MLDLLTGLTLNGQQVTKTQTDCRFAWETEKSGNPVVGQKLESRKRLAGFVIRFAGYEPENHKRENGLPVLKNR